MRLLLFSDLHGDVDAARRLVELARKRAVDLLLGAGDFCNARQNLAACVDVLRDGGKPAVLVAGNNETTDELILACRDWPGARVLHGSGAAVAGVSFFGLGGGVPVTPFGPWSYDFTERQAADLLAACPPGGVLVSHSPPKGVVDVSSRGQSLGSAAVRDAVERLRPMLVVCGHIHGSAGRRAMIGPTTVVNAGPGGVEWSLSTPANA